MDTNNAHPTESQDNLFDPQNSVPIDEPRESIDPSSSPHVRNADNEDLHPIDEYGDLLGQIDEVNGRGATEVPFTPTRFELLVIVRHWADVAVRLYWDDFVFGIEDRWLSYRFARRRLVRASDLLGEDAVNQAIEEAADDLRRSLSLTLREWDIFRHGSWEERDEIDRITKGMRGQQRTHREPEPEQQRQRIEMEEWRKTHQAARDEERRKREERREKKIGGRVAETNREDSIKWFE
jgi:hypothetical protein